MSAPAPQAPKQGSLAWTALAVWLAPRRAGRRIARRGLGGALLTHLIGLAGMIGVLWLAGEVLADTFNRRTGTDYANVSLGLLEALRAYGPPWLADVPLAALAGGLLLGFEIHLWPVGIVVLGPWTGLPGSRRRMVHRAAVTLGFASLWLIPLAIVLAAAGSTVLLTALHRGPISTIVHLAWGVGLAWLPAGMLAMALRLASGVGDVQDDQAPSSRQAEPLCETCGYNLHATPFAGRCPECGQPARRSLSPIWRVNAWEVGQQGFWKTAGQALCRPGGFFRTLPIRHDLDHARSFVLRTSVASGLLMGAMIFLTRQVEAVLVLGLPWRTAQAAEGVGTALAWAGFWAMAVTIVSMLAAGTMASTSWRRGDHLGASGAMKVAAYTSALALPWAVLLALLASLLRYLEFLGVEAALSAGPGTASPITPTTIVLIWTVIGVGLLTWYWVVLARAYAATQYANT